MTNQPEKSEEKIVPSPVDLEAEESVWGSEWEDAFQAAKKESSEEETIESNRLLFESESDEEETAEESNLVAESFDTEKESLPFAFTLQFARTILAIPLRAWIRFRNLKQPYQTVVGVFLALLIIAFIGGKTFLAKNSPGHKETSDTGATTQPESPPLPSLLPEQEITAEVPEKRQVNWDFSPFLIPVNNPHEKKAAFLELELNIVVVLGPDEEFPSDKKIFIRNIIYQFYRNLSWDELRRFSLARGEMKRKLKGWLLEYWPEAPVETITIKYYKLT